MFNIKNTLIISSLLILFYCGNLNITPSIGINNSNENSEVNTDIVYPYVTCISQNKFVCNDLKYETMLAKEDFQIKCLGFFYERSSCSDLFYNQTCRLASNKIVITKSQQSCKNYNSLNSNGSFSPQTLTINTQSDISYREADTLKWFLIPLSRNIPYKIIVTRNNTSSFDINIYKSSNLNDSIQSFSTSTSLTDSFIFTPDTIDNYYLSFEKASESATNIQISIQTPSNLVVGTASTNKALVKNNYDWYQVPLLANNLYTLSSSNTNGFLYSVFNSSLEQIVLTNNNQFFSSTINSTYYIRVENVSNTTANNLYTVNILNSLVQASLNSQIIDSLSSTNKEKWYSVNLTTDTYYRIYLSNSNLRYTLLDSNKTTVLLLSDLFKVATAGIYYIKIDSINSVGVYTFIIGEPSLLTVNTAFTTGEFLTNKRYQWFKIVLNQGSTYEVKMSNINLFNNVYDSYFNVIQTNSIETNKKSFILQAAEANTPTTSTYYISLYNGTIVGTYTMNVCLNTCP